MSDYSTEDCKRFLAQQFPHTLPTQWKRTRKYKDAENTVCRDFTHGTDQTITLKETPQGLMVCSPDPVPLNTHSTGSSQLLHEIFQSLPKGFKPMNLREHFFGGGSTRISPTHAQSPYDSFLHVLCHGIDWNAPKGQRSAFDFSQSLDFNVLVAHCSKHHIDLLDSFLNYMSESITMLFDMDETAMPQAIYQANFDDSCADLITLLKNLQQAYAHHHIPFTLHTATCTHILNLLTSIESSIDCQYQAEPHKAQLACYEVLDAMRACLQSQPPKTALKP